MEKFPEPDKPDKRSNQNTTESIKKLYVQIRKMPELTVQAKAIDQVLLNKIKDLKGTASTVLEQFNQQKKAILKRFDNWIMPIAKEVLESFLQDAEHLKENLDEKIDHIEQTTPEEWNDQAEGWAVLYDRWHDRKALVDKILEVVADRAKYLIDKDIQVIHDYQTQSISHLPEESEVKKDIEERLSQAIAEPLKKLVALREVPKGHTTLQQASEWVAKLHEKRESYFDHLLMKIDHVTKDVVQPEEANDWGGMQELKGEVLFMESELEHIKSDLTQIHPESEADRQFIAARLEGLLDHAEGINETSIPIALKEKIHQLKEEIEKIASQIIPPNGGVGL